MEYLFYCHTFACIFHLKISIEEFTLKTNRADILLYNQLFLDALISIK